MKALLLTVVLASASPAGAMEYAITSSVVGALTGPEAPGDMQRPDVCGTDLGTMAEIGGKIIFAFGDTFGWRGGACTRFAPNWRSNVIGMTSDMDPSDGVVIDDWLADPNGRAVAAIEGQHRPKFVGEQTKIPTAMVSVGSTLYLHYMSVHGFADMGGVWLCNASRFISSKDAGKSWDTGTEEFGGFESSFNMLALSAQSGGGNKDGKYVYAMGTPCGRFSGARIARIEAAEFPAASRWQYWDGAAWVADRAKAAEIIRPGVGEGSLVWNAGIGRWMYTTLNELSRSIELRFAERPQGPWSDPAVLVRGTDFDQAYGAFMTPSWISDDGLTFYFLMSQFGPYNVFVMRAELRPDL